MEDVIMTAAVAEATPKVQRRESRSQKNPPKKSATATKKSAVHEEALEDEDDDPIVRSYDIYIKPNGHVDRQFVVMQFPNRDMGQPYNEDSGSAPLAIRMKPKAGMFEMDVPVDPWNNYDRLKGVKMGDALNKSESMKGAGSHGLAGGFGIGAGPPAARGRQKAVTEEKDEDALLADFPGAVQRREVLAKQTLGGQSVAKDGIRPQYMIGVFRDNQLHLTPVDHLVQMRPQFHHVDAMVEAEARATPRTAPTGPREARAVHLTAKSAIDGEEENEETMAERIAAVQAEQWKTFHVIDENSQQAWDSYYENMFVGTDKGLKTDEELRSNMPKLKSAWNNEEYLEALAPKRTTAKIKEKKPKGKGAVGEEEPEVFDLENLEDTDSD